MIWMEQPNKTRAGVWLPAALPAWIVSGGCQKVEIRRNGPLVAFLLFFEEVEGVSSRSGSSS